MNYLLRVSDKIQRNRETKDWKLTLDIQARTSDTKWETVSTYTLPGLNSRKAAKLVRKQALSILTSTIMHRTYQYAIKDTVRDFNDALNRRLKKK